MSSRDAHATEVRALKPLDAKERVFVDQYLIDLDPQRAALKAGYSATMASSKVYQWVSDSKTKPHVFEAVRAAMAKRALRTEITADRVLAELGKIGFSDIRKAVVWKANVTGMQEQEDGSERLAITNEVQLVDSAELDDETAAAIAEISQTAQGGLKIKMHDKLAALTQIGRHLGMFKDKIEHSGVLTLEHLIMNSLAKPIEGEARVIAREDKEKPE